MNFLKNQVTFLNLFLALGAIIALLLWKKRNRLALRLTIISFILFILCSTKVVPYILAKQIETKYNPLDTAELKGLDETVYIIVLGSGYSSSTSLPCTALLGASGLARLTEAVRIYRVLQSPFIIASGGSVSEPPTQAWTVRCAAIELGISPDRIITLDHPSSTIEEAQELYKAVGSKIKLVVVTDALHMPRAIEIFNSFGFNPLPAPTNFITRSASFGIDAWWPSLSNLQVMDRIMHEYFGNIKHTLTLQFA